MCIKTVINAWLKKLIAWKLYSSTLCSSNLPSMLAAWLEKPITDNCWSCKANFCSSLRCKQACIRDTLTPTAAVAKNM